MALAWPLLALPPAQAAPTSSEPLLLQADTVRSEIDRRSVAEGNVSLRQAGLSMTADYLELLHDTRLAIARGHVALEQDGNRFSGDEAQVQVDSRQGYVLAPRYYFGRVGAGGRASRVDFTGTERLSAHQASYTSCRPDDPDDADWVLKAEQIDLDFAHNDGTARHAVLRFLGVPILGAPALSFPTSDARKSGWLPPTIYPFDSRNGFEAEVPYYFNLAPNYDLTLTPGILTRRGVVLTSEFRYLFADDKGRVQTHVLPNDQVEGRTRYSLILEHEGRMDGGITYAANIQQPSDNDYWKDFSNILPSLTPRMFPQDVNVRRQWSLAGDGRVETYAAVQGWHTLQQSDALIDPPYQRAPQVGLRLGGTLPYGVVGSLTTEVNHFVLRDRVSTTDLRSDGTRVHALGELRQPNDLGWGWLTPRLAFNAASYDTDTPMSDGRTRAGRVVPTLSVDAGLRFERPTTLWGRSLYQTLEPRIHLVQTPWRNQDALPNYDAAPYDFNEISIYGDNAFTGVDYVNDAHQVTFGATSRWFDTRHGEELLRLGLAERYEFGTQRITPDRLGTAGLSAEDGTTNTRFSDLMLFGSATLWPHWHLDVTEQYSPDQARTTRSILSARWHPAPYQTLSATYRYTRGLSEQMELGWQWPVYRRDGAAGSSGAGRCAGTLYAVGYATYSLQDSRLTNGIAGLEYDAGCWIGRVVFERTSTSASEATTRLMLQLELVGLSRLGANPLKVLKDNVPGYQLLRDDNAPATNTAEP